ncbi:nuclear matrix protein [Hortaea werneckii]|uniref:Nuclear matrix protein n=2 Tax=Hortaea werneckii TaxID=91943 RepID=A0A3M7GM09_HORWE|nr:nuclear matrix protein [Hortaea werneckii]OTA38440.1 hypothetical protein BTJ68_01734 [Hortaea werneckii EXF-2000]KAI6921078.1 nuclear matrix protein [Hortaea werneckii]KAI6936480.1 nuclear matrix protein [Hortaea werneckii]KAI6955543.1 nuclear matrix protein [Hortaea werneckii]
MAAGSAAELQPVAQVTQRLQSLLEHAKGIKPQESIDPPLPTSELLPEIDALHDGLDSKADSNYKLNVVETAARGIFYDQIKSTDIHEAGFVRIWNLIDILVVASDRGYAAAEVPCYFIEELLDSQTTIGCRKVFDYLESRRERLVAKDFHKKNLIFLRSCNELLRRLSRAEDAIFCGRVFFFLFQTFPLGDKSAVNLRGEYHTENMTKFDVSEAPDAEEMEVDKKPAEGDDSNKAETPQPPTKPGGKATPARPNKRTPEEVVLSSSELYPIFWRLQQDFSQPTRLFAKDDFATFKKGLSQTLAKFKKTPTVVSAKSSGDRRGVKRKSGEDNPEEDAADHFADNYNPKYLTSRDLFDLELSDLAFQRHIMVQALILIDFLLSLTEQAKKKLKDVRDSPNPNRSVLYGFTLSQEDAKWATDTRQTINDYLINSPVTNSGRFYHRMVETILTRDKNWARWKAENCPSIVRDPVSTEEELQARQGVKNATKVRRVPLRTPGAIDLSFLDEGQGGGLEALKDPSRFTAPSVEELIEVVRTDKLDLEMAMDEDEKTSLENLISNKTWRALRQVRASDLSLLDKVDPAKSIEDVLQPPPEVSSLRDSNENVDGEGGDAAAPAVTVSEDTGAAQDGAGASAEPADDHIANTTGEGTSQSQPIGGSAGTEVREDTEMAKPVDDNVPS